MSSSQAQSSGDNSYSSEATNSSDSLLGVSMIMLEIAQASLLGRLSQLEYYAHHEPEIFHALMRHGPEVIIMKTPDIIPLPDISKHERRSRQSRVKHFCVAASLKGTKCTGHGYANAIISNKKYCMRAGKLQG